MKTSLTSTALLSLNLMVVAMVFAPIRSFSLATKYIHNLTKRYLSASSSSVLLSDTLSIKLKDPSLLTSWKPSVVENDDLTWFDVYDPATSMINSIAQVPSLHAHVEPILETSQEALETKWRDGTTAAYRGSLLAQWSQLMLQPDILDDLAVIMTMESGKPLAESKGEIKYAASFLEYFAAEAIRPTNGGFLVPTPFVQADGGSRPRGQIMAKQQAVGVCAMITPWNFPAAMITRKIGPALAAGCTAVIKPSELTPLSAIALCTLAERAGIPREVVQLVPSSTEHTPSVGASFCQDARVQKISFTGSTNVGKWLLEKSASTIKRMSLELGGNAPFIVFEDADLELSSAAAVASKFRNAGQTCVCADRFLVHSSVHDAFVKRVMERVQSLRLGNGMEEDTTLGPLISLKAVENVDAKVKQAVEMGATLHTGGHLRSEIGPQFYEPTILSNVTVDSDIWQLETFGPVMAIRAFDTECEATSIANDSSVGLASYFCTKDLSRAFRVADRYVNVPTNTYGDRLLRVISLLTS